MHSLSGLCSQSDSIPLYTLILSNRVVTGDYSCFKMTAEPNPEKWLTLGLGDMSITVGLARLQVG